MVEIASLKNGLNVLELWHGDTLAFKDLAMTCTLEFMNYFLKKRKRHFTSIVGKSFLLHKVESRDSFFSDTGKEDMGGARGPQNPQEEELVEGRPLYLGHLRKPTIILTPTNG